MVHERRPILLCAVLRTLLFIVPPVFFGCLAVYLGQDANWDFRNYHWYNAYAFLNDRYGFDLLAAQTPSFYNPLLDVPFFVLASHVSAPLAQFILGAVQGLNAILLYALARQVLAFENHRLNIVLAVSVAALGMLGGGGIAMLGTTFYDNITSLGLFLSAWLVVRNGMLLADGVGAKPLFWALIFGMPAGMMMGLKLPSVIFCVGLCFALLGLTSSLRRNVVLAFVFGVGVLLGFALTYGYWGWHLAHDYGNPFFPYFNQFFGSPYAPATSARDVQFIPNGFKNFALFPFLFAQNPLLVGEVPWCDWRIPILYSLMALLLVSSVTRLLRSANNVTKQEGGRYLLLVGAISYAVWLFMFSIYRYLVPLEMLAPLLIALAIDRLITTPKAKLIAIVALLVLIAQSVEPANWYRRKAWTGRVVEAALPPLGNTSNLMVLMAGFEPYSHILTTFPRDIRFVRVQSNFASPEENKGINEMIHDRINAHRARGGRFMLLIPTWQHDMADKALNSFGLGLARTLHARKPCQKVIDRLYDYGDLDLCDVIELP